MVSQSTIEESQRPWIETPCIYSTSLSKKAGCNIYLKLEKLQPSGSFKSRGIGNFLLKAIEKHGVEKPIRFYCSSGGNAGLACATAAAELSRPCTIVVPLTTSTMMMERIKERRAEVVQRGAHWLEADTHLREDFLGKDANGVYVPPFDHPDVWEGNASLADELESQMWPKGGFDAVVCSVGGGGLYSGLMTGLERHNRLVSSSSLPSKPIKILTMETEGAHSLHLSIRAGELSKLPTITSIATSLGATQVCFRAFEYGQMPEVTSQVISDAEAATACVLFADDERILVEAACGATLAAAYKNDLSEKEKYLKKVLFGKDSDETYNNRNVVLVVCGRSNITIDMLNGYKEKLDTMGK